MEIPPGEGVLSCVLTVSTDTQNCCLWGCEELHWVQSYRHVQSPLHQSRLQDQLCTSAQRHRIPAAPTSVTSHLCSSVGQRASQPRWLLPKTWH